MKRVGFLLFLLTGVVSFSQTTSSPPDKMQWFADAKLGIFIHWGLYSVKGIDESWSFYNGYISHKDYMTQKKGFTAKRYNPEEWVRLIKESGAKYSVITSKHHEGFALWDSKDGVLNAVKHSPAKRDLLTPFVNEARKQGLKVGIYFSLPDWSYKDYTDFTREIKRYKIADDPQRWQRFLNYYQGQLQELSSLYKPDIFWFDGDWEHTPEEWETEKMRAQLLKDNPNLIINNRLGGKGDYATPEQGIPIHRPQAHYWEQCMTINDSWGYQPTDHNYKTADQIIANFADIIGNGGNLLLDIGPKADGTIPEKQVEVLRTLGKWVNKHQEAIYGTTAGIPKDYFNGPSTLSKDKTILYLFVKGNPGEIAVKGLNNEINRIWIVGTGVRLDHQVIGKIYWSKYPGIKYVKLPPEALDDHITVLALLLNGPIDLFEKEVSKIEDN